MTGEADLERVAALRPDLIFHATAYQQIQIDTLAAIAPVISYEAAPTGLLAPLTWLGQLLGVEDRAARLKADLVATIDQNQATIGLTGRRVALINLGNYEATPQVSIGGGGTNIGELAELLGAVVVPEQINGKPLRGTFVDVSLELAPSTLRGADFIIASYYSGTADNEQRYRARVADPCGGPSRRSRPAGSPISTFRRPTALRESGGFAPPWPTWPNRPALDDPSSSLVGLVAGRGIHGDIVACRRLHDERLGAS